MTNAQIEAVPLGQTSMKKLDSLVWGILLIWIGIALFTALGWGIGLLGVGAILLCEQAARKYMGGSIEIFWIVVGAVFITGGVSELSNVHISLVPVACIVAGVALLLSALFEKTQSI